MNFSTLDDYKSRFERVQELGRGRFGVVYEVKATSSGLKYAAKHVKARKRDVRKSIKAEAELLNGLDHERVLGLDSAFEDASQVVLVTELLSGGELFERVVADDEFNLTEAECVLFLRQICEGVAYLHTLNIVHLDLKPENIVCVSKAGNDVKIIDFGLARVLDPEVEVKVMCGTAEFVSPEVVNYDPVSTASDMWSVGVIAYVLLSGLSPFMGDDAAETYCNVSRAEFDFDEPEFEAISAEAKNFIGGLLVKIDEKRLTANQCLKHEWISKSNFDVDKIIDKSNLKKFLARRRWQRCGQAIR